MKYFTKDNFIIFLVVLIGIATVLYFLKGCNKNDDEKEVIVKTTETTRDVVRIDSVREKKITDSFNRVLKVKDVVISNTKQELSATKYLVEDMLKDLKKKKPCDDTTDWAKRIDDLQIENHRKDILCDSVINILEQDTAILKNIISEKDRSLATTRFEFGDCSKLNEQLSGRLNDEIKKNKSKTGWNAFFKGTTVAMFLFAIFKSL